MMIMIIVITIMMAMITLIKDGARRLERQPASFSLSRIRTPASPGAHAHAHSDADAGASAEGHEHAFKGVEGFMKTLMKMQEQAGNLYFEA